MLKIKELKTKIEKIVFKLNQIGKNDLAVEINNNWNKTLIKYSEEINTYKPAIEMEDVLKKSFEKELSRLDYNKNIISEIIKDLKEHRIIQTAPHLVPSNGPRMFFIDWLSSLNLNKRKFYVVGMYSGIPFSNSFYPGCISYSNQTPLEKIINSKSKEYKEIKKIKNNANNIEEKISLIPSKIQDDLVYKSSISEKTINMIMSFSNPLKKIFIKPSLYENDYTKWSLQCQKEINSKILNKNNLVYIDINEVITNYLIQICKDKKHILHKILFIDKKLYTDNFKEEKLFVLPYSSGKYTENEMLLLKNGYLVGKHNKIKFDPKNIMEYLQNKRMCPSIFLCFTVLSFLNSFKCLGSFRQAVYLPKYKEVWINSNILNNKYLEKVPCCNLTTGYFTDKKMSGIRPLDILAGKKFIFNNKILFGEIIIAVEKNLYS